jgi:hypothetical protein
MADEYHRYLARCQFMLRQGVAVADILYLTPEGAPHAFRPPASAVRGNPPDHREYNFDACSPETLIARAKVKHGQIVFPGGMSYRLLALPNVDTMTPTLLRKIKGLAKAGATIVGAPPRKSPSLANYPQCDIEVQEIAREIWGEFGVPASAGPAWKPPEGGTPNHKRKLGNGHVVWGGELTKHTSGKLIKKSALEGARWIWFDEGNAAVTAPVATRYFRRELVLPVEKAIESAHITVTADNQFELWVNDRKVGSGGNFNKAFQFDIAPLLTAGNNFVFMEVNNGGAAPNPGGLIATVKVRFVGGQTLTLETDRQWQSAAHVGTDWRSEDKSGERWQLAKELGEWSISPWGRVGEEETEPEIYPDYGGLAALLRADGVPPDFESDGPLRYTHRRDGTTEIYFVANRSADTCAVTARFRVTGKAPEFWNPLTGKTRRAQVWKERDGQTFVPLRLDAHDSLFVVFHQSAKTSDDKEGRNWDEFVTVGEVTGPWEVNFQPGRGAPEKLTFAKLEDWSKHSAAGVRYFSGVATYRTTFDGSPEPSSIANRQSRICLGLGRVEVMARVKLNGKDVGTVWKSPFRVDVTGALRSGENRLEIQVANLWPNRLIGDAALPKEQRVGWTTWNPFKKDDPLFPSGLIGPVQLQVTKTNNLQSANRNWNYRR